MKINWNFLGGGGMQNKNSSVVGSVDIFWNCTLADINDFILCSLLGRSTAEVHRLCEQSRR